MPHWIFFTSTPHLVILLDLGDLMRIKKNKKQTISKKVKIPKLTKEDGQSEKLEEKRMNVKKGFKPLFGKDVNDPSERGHD